LGKLGFEKFSLGKFDLKKLDLGLEIFWETWTCKLILIFGEIVFGNIKSWDFNQSFFSYLRLTQQVYWDFSLKASLTKYTRFISHQSCIINRKKLVRKYIHKRHKKIIFWFRRFIIDITSII
jgi:hypothetical protein